MYTLYFHTKYTTFVYMLLFAETIWFMLKNWNIFLWAIYEIFDLKCALAQKSSQFFCVDNDISIE